jgi:steroid Delta-isomerase
MPDRDHIVAAVETYCRTETVKDREGWLALFADNIVHEDPVGVAVRTGMEGVGQLWEMIVAGDVDLRLTDDVIVCGNEAIALMACETGPAGARRKTGPIVDHFIFDEDGKIVSLRAFYKYA